jgi:hypothetical protein
LIELGEYVIVLAISVVFKLEDVKKNGIEGIGTPVAIETGAGGLARAPHLSDPDQPNATNGGDSTMLGPEGLLFTGDIVRTLSAEQLAALGSFANRMFGLEMQPIHKIARELGEHAFVAADRADTHRYEPIDLSGKSIEEIIELEYDVRQVNEESPDFAVELGEGYLAGLEVLPVQDTAKAIILFDKFAQSGDEDLLRTAASMSHSAQRSMTVGSGVVDPVAPSTI